jgi:hypothetical protein
VFYDEWFNQIANLGFLGHYGRDVTVFIVWLFHGGDSFGAFIAASCGKTSGRQGDLAVGEGIAFRDSAAFVLVQRHPRVNVTI